MAGKEVENERNRTVAPFTHQSPFYLNVSISRLNFIGFHVVLISKWRPRFSVAVLKNTIH